MQHHPALLVCETPCSQLAARPRHLRRIPRSAGRGRALTTVRMAKPAASRSTAGGMARSGDIRCALANVRMTLVACGRRGAWVPEWREFCDPARARADRSKPARCSAAAQALSPPLTDPAARATMQSVHSGRPLQPWQAAGTLKMSASSDAPSGELSQERSTLPSVTSCTGGCTARAIVPGAAARARPEPCARAAGEKAECAATQAIGEARSGCVSGLKRSQDSSLWTTVMDGGPEIVKAHISALDCLKLKARHCTGLVAAQAGRGRRGRSHARGAAAHTGQEGLQRVEQRGAGGADALRRGLLEARRQQQAARRAAVAEQLPAQAAVVPRARQQLEARGAAAAAAGRAVGHPQRRLQRQQVPLALHAC